MLGMEMSAVTLEDIMELTEELKMELSYGPGFLLLGMYPKKPKTLIQKNISTPMFIAALFTIANVLKQT